MIHLAKNTIDNKDIDRLIEWLKGYPRLTKGKVTVEYEEEWSRLLGAKYSLFVNSGSSANLLMLHTLVELGILRRGSRVVVPALSWSTDLAPVFQLGLEPVLCDCNLDDLSVDLEHLQQIIDEHSPKALMLVSVLGLVPDMDKISQICEDNGMVLLEDACESFGSKFNGKHLGTFGLMSSFSTYFGHHLSTIEGGIVCTDDKHIFNILKSLRSHGWDRDMEESYQKDLREAYNIKPFNDLYTFYYSGFNFRSTDLQAYIGLGQLEKFDEVIQKRNQNYNLYNELLQNSFWKPKSIDGRYVSNFAYPVIHPKRDEIVENLNASGVENRPLICGSLGRQPVWRKKYGYTPLENADTVHDHGLYLPNNHHITADEVELVCEIVNRSIK